eukprot:4764181-Amphidinium_carterae.1
MVYFEKGLELLRHNVVAVVFREAAIPVGDFGQVCGIAATTVITSRVVKSCGEKFKSLRECENC